MNLSLAIELRSQPLDFLKGGGQVLLTLRALGLLRGDQSLTVVKRCLSHLQPLR